jgi:hypothetical protein
MNIASIGKEALIGLWYGLANIKETLLIKKSKKKKKYIFVLVYSSG